MSEALQAYRHVAASDEFKEIERARSIARHDRAQALNNAERRGIALGEARGIALGETRGEARGIEKMLITALKSNAHRDVISAMQKSAGITDAQLNQLKLQAGITLFRIE